MTALVPFLMVGVALTVVWWTRPPAAHSTAAESAKEECAPLVIDWSGDYRQCFLPDHAREAARLLPFKPIDPTSEVRAIAGVELQQVLVIRQIPHGPGPNVTDPIAQGTAIGISYFYGSMPGGLGMVPDTGASSPRFVIVTESRMSRGNQPDGISSLTSSDASPGPYGPWGLHVTMPRRGTTLDITTNAPRDVVQSLSAALVK